MATSSGASELEEVKQKITEIETDLKSLLPDNPERLLLRQELVALRQEKVLLLQSAGGIAQSSAQAGGRAGTLTAADDVVDMVTHGLIKALTRLGLVRKHISLSGVGTDMWNEIKGATGVDLRSRPRHKMQSLLASELTAGFKWHLKLTEAQQRQLEDDEGEDEGYQAYVKKLIGDLPEIELHAGDESEKLLSNLGSLDLPLCGKSDLMFIHGNAENVLIAIRCLIEVKKKVERRHLLQAYLQVLIANALSRHLRPFVFLTDLNAKWLLLYIDGTILYELNMERDLAVAFIKHVLQEEKVDDGAQLQPSSLPNDIDIFFKRREMVLAGPTSAPQVPDVGQRALEDDDDDDVEGGGDARGAGRGGDSSAGPSTSGSSSGDSPAPKRPKQVQSKRGGDGSKQQRSTHSAPDTANLADLTGLLGADDAYDAQVHVVVDYFRREIAPLFQV